MFVSGGDGISSRLGFLSSLEYGHDLMGLRKEGGPNIIPQQSPSTLVLLVRVQSSKNTIFFLLHFPDTPFLPLPFQYKTRNWPHLGLYPCTTQLWASQRILRPEVTASDMAGSANMAALGAGGFAPVLAALSTMQSNAERSQKSQAHMYLEKFQKSVGLIWYFVIHIVNRTDIDVARGVVNDTLDSIY